MIFIIYYIPTYSNGCDNTDPYALRLSASIILYVIPLTLILTSNILTIYELKKRNKIKQASGLGKHIAAPATVVHPQRVEETVINSHDHATDIHSIKTTDPHKYRREFIKAIKPYICLFCVSFSIIVCFTPYIIMSFVSEWGDLDSYKIFSTLTYFIGVANPIILLIFQDSFRHEFKHYICCNKQS